MTTTTPAIIDARRKAGFTLVEMMITIIVLVMITGAVLSAFLFFNKTGINIGNYIDMDRQARIGLEKFAEDARMAADITLTSSSEITFKNIPLDDAGLYHYDVTYRYLPSSYSTASLRSTFARKVVNSNNTGLMANDSDFVALVTNVTMTTFRAYKVGSPTGATASSPTIPLATNPLETKQINIDLTTERRSTLVARATNVVLSGRYVLRNKVVVN